MGIGELLWQTDKMSGQGGQWVGEGGNLWWSFIPSRAKTALSVCSHCRNNDNVWQVYLTLPICQKLVSLQANKSVKWLLSRFHLYTYSHYHFLNACYHTGICTRLFWIAESTQTSVRIPGLEVPWSWVEGLLLEASSVWRRTWSVTKVRRHVSFYTQKPPSCNK